VARKTAITKCASKKMGGWERKLESHKGQFYRTGVSYSQTKTSHFYSKTNKMHQRIKFIFFWNDTLHVSDGLSVHHQEFKTVYTATSICQTDTADWLLASSSSICLTYTCCCKYSLELLMTSESCRVAFQNKINFIYWCILLVLL